MRQAVKALAFAALIFGAAFDASATIRWVGFTATGNGSGSDAQNIAAFTNTTNLVNVIFGGALTRGDTMWLCGDFPGSVTWNPGGISAGTGVFFVSGKASDSGCAAGRWSGTISIGGGGRQFITLDNITYFDCVTCLDISGTSITVQNSNFSRIKTTPIKIGSQTATTIAVTGNVFSDYGTRPDVSNGAVNIIPGDGVAVSGVTISGNIITGNGIVRYGVNGYPSGASSTGTITGVSVAGNIFRGSFSQAVVNFTNITTSPNSITDNDFSGVGNPGAAVIHLGGQSQKETGCTTPGTTAGFIISGNIGVHGGRPNGGNPADGAGIYPDECSSDVQILRNEIFGNVFADVYLNDAANVSVIGNTMGAFGDAAIHVHGITSGTLTIYGNSMECKGNPSGGADQGVDCVQIDAAVTASVTMRDNAIRCLSLVAKCVDADVAITENNNFIYATSVSTTRSEGIGPDSSDPNLDPAFIKANAERALDFCPSSTSALRTSKGVKLAGTTDKRNTTYETPPTIGAYELSGACPSAARTSRTY